MRCWATLFRRFVVVCALGLWLGGTTLYTGFVIPIGHRHFSESQFGSVTQDVTRMLNGLGAFALVVLLLNLIADWKSLDGFIRWGALGSWILSTIALIALFEAHSKLHLLLKTGHRSGDESFDLWHEAYKVVTAIQWGAALLHLGFVLAAWRRSDRATPGRTG